MMQRCTRWARGLATLVLMAALAACAPLAQRVEGTPAGSGGPRCAVDAAWPKPLPNN